MTIKRYTAALIGEPTRADEGELVYFRDVIDLIESETELPGDPPYDLQELVDHYGLVELLRAIVRGTKESLLERLNGVK